MSSVKFCGKSECLCPGEDLHGKQEPQTHADLFIAYSTRDCKNFSLLKDEDSLNQHLKVSNVVSARLSCLKAYTLLREQFAVLPF